MKKATDPAPHPCIKPYIWSGKSNIRPRPHVISSGCPYECIVGSQHLRMDSSTKLVLYRNSHRNISKFMLTWDTLDRRDDLCKWPLTISSWGKIHTLSFSPTPVSNRVLTSTYKAYLRLAINISYIYIYTDGSNNNILYVQEVVTLRKNIKYICIRKWELHHFLIITIF